jgi:hypothetical protein
MVGTEIPVEFKPNYLANGPRTGYKKAVISPVR